MNEYVLVYCHDVIRAVTIHVNVKSELTPDDVERDAEPIFEIADELLDGAEQSAYEFTMIAIMHNGGAIVEYNHTEPQLEWDAKQAAKKAAKGG